MTHVCESSFGTKVHVGNCSERYPSFEEQFIKINEIIEEVNKLRKLVTPLN